MKLYAEHAQQVADLLQREVTIEEIAELMGCGERAIRLLLASSPPERSDPSRLGKMLREHDVYAGPPIEAALDRMLSQHPRPAAARNALGQRIVQRLGGQRQRMTLTRYLLLLVENDLQAAATE